MAAMYAAVDTMSNQIVLFTTLQGLTMQLLILRLIRVLSAQKRLSILASTTIKVAAHTCSAAPTHLPSSMSSVTDGLFFTKSLVTVASCSAHGAVLGF